MSAWTTLFATFLISQDPEIRRVVAAVADVAVANHAKPAAERLDGDALADRYFRSACATGEPPTAVVLGLGYALEPTGLIAKNPLAAERFKDVETPEGRKKRLSAMGKPTLHGREDWLSHFVVSAGMTALVGDPLAESIGVQKELTDAVAKSAGDGSGFSFTDLNADFAGITFAAWLIDPKSRLPLEKCANSVRGDDFIPASEGLRDGLTLAEFEAAWGGTNDARFLAERRRLRARTKECKGYEEK